MGQSDPTCGKVNAGELARLFGVSRKHIYALIDRGLPRQGRLFDVAACFRWYVAELEPEEKEPEDLTSARLALFAAQTEKLRLENARTRRESVDIEEAKAVLLGVAAIVAGQLDALGPRVAPTVLGMDSVRDIQDEIFRETRDVRGSIAREIGGFDPASGEHCDPAAESNRRSVGRRKPRAATG